MCAESSEWMKLGGKAVRCRDLWMSASEEGRCRAIVCSAVRTWGRGGEREDGSV